MNLYDHFLSNKKNSFIALRSGRFLFLPPRYYAEPATSLFPWLYFVVLDPCRSCGDLFSGWTAPLLPFSLSFCVLSLVDSLSGRGFSLWPFGYDDFGSSKYFNLQIPTFIITIFVLKIGVTRFITNKIICVNESLRHRGTGQKAKDKVAERDVSGWLK